MPKPSTEDAPLPSRAALTDIRAAANAGWEIPEAGRRKAVLDCLRILADGEAGGRLKMTAIRTMLAIERLNQTLALKAAAHDVTVPPNVEDLIALVYRDDAPHDPDSATTPDLLTDAD